MSQSRQPGTPSLLRAINDRAALELLLERGPLTRAQLGELTGLSKVTASQLVERLEERRLVSRVGELAGGRGPNAQLYAVVPSSAYVVGVQVGPREVVAASADITGRTTARVEISTHDTDDPVGRVHAAVVEAADQAGASWDRVRRIVLGTPGVVDPTTGDISFAFDLPRWHHGLRRCAQRRPRPPGLVRERREPGRHRGGPARCRPRRGRLRAHLDQPGRRSGDRARRAPAPRRGRGGRRDRLPLRARRTAPGPRPGREPAGGHAVVPADHQRDGPSGVWPASTGSGRRRRATPWRRRSPAGRPGEPVLDELARRVALGVVAVCVVLDPSLVVLAGDVGSAGGEALAGRVQDQVTRLAPVSPRVVVTGCPTTRCFRARC